MVRYTFVTLIIILTVGFVFMSLMFSFSTNSTSVNSVKHIPVLMYHHFDKTISNSVTVSPERFREQLEYLKKEGYETINDWDLLLFHQGEKELPEKPVMITIDDGYLSNYEYAYPILKDLEMKATIFVVASARGQTPGHIPHFSWEQAREMYESGFIEIQNHSYDGHYKVMQDGGEVPVLLARLENESEEDYLERIKNDFLRSKELIEMHVGNKVISFAYPYGAFDDTLEQIALETGHHLLFTVRPGVHNEKESTLQIKRINVPGHFSGEDIIRIINKYKDKSAN
ncbi:polysaccharide deacetylase [Caldalkalibacillus thermarum TA2.A1]|uniref:Polysaccharide deacetylase n=1 Tax=Caldalkalibacillus thermarum (strain TA2.A1) TaxID=986075 RepID=F5L996_CALTT|nr:polysaccharide deacetylase family protein [Caldalkalibacillus thermarum]EGL82038.1 polysaccharide deacetylase [Caldalkalibacillus thermarum TA2.A1]QZT34044.1 polysaccharide deacetylase family protein [Caldalkalibacillus thermarum TA2.A1]